MLATVTNNLQAIPELLWQIVPGKTAITKQKRN